MSQRSHNLDTTLLTIELLRLIPRHGKTTAAELQQRLAYIGFERDARGSRTEFLDYMTDLYRRMLNEHLDAIGAERGIDVGPSELAQPSDPA